MKKRLLFICFLIASIASVKAQHTLSGTVTDQLSKLPLYRATVAIRSLSDSSSQKTLTDSAGRFAFTGLKKDSFLLAISYTSYASYLQKIKIDSTDINLSIAAVPKNASNDLATVVIATSISPFRQKADTIEMSASQYKVNPDASAADLVKKMPGITIQNGQVTANGETVQKVTIDGRELFGNDATAALQNLPAEIIDKIQVFDRLSDQAQFTGFDDGNTQKSINIITKTNMRNGQFGHVFAGYGTDGRYNAGGNTTFLHGDQKVSIVGLFNNINQQNFSTQDLLGISNNGGQRGGGGGGYRGGGGRGGSPQGGGGYGANSTFLVGNQSGINKTNSFGVNYADNWGKKLQVTGSYFFNNTDNLTEQISNNQYFDKFSPSNRDTTNSNSNNFNHRINLRFDYKIDSANEIIFTPYWSFQKNNSDQNDQVLYYYPGDLQDSLLSHINSNTNSDISGNNLNNTLLIRHRFAKRGRTISLNINETSNLRDGGIYLNQIFHTYATNIDSTVNQFTKQHNNGYQLSANLAYTEPIGQHSMLQLNYNSTYSKSTSDQETFDQDSLGKYTVLMDSLSNTFTSIYKTQNGGASYRYNYKDLMLSFGANYQFSDLSSERVFPSVSSFDKTFSNILPNAMLRWKMSTRSNLRIFYRSSANQPSVTQLQDVVDRASNSPNVVIGNPNLNQQITNLLSTRYTFTNPEKGTLFVANIFVQNAQNYIANDLYIPQKKDSILSDGKPLNVGQQLSRPINLNGYLSLRSFFTFAIPLKFIKTQLNFNGGISYNKIPGITNEQENMSNTITYTSGIVLASNISQYVDFTISYTPNWNSVKNSNPISGNSNTNYFSHTASVNLNLLSKSGWFYQTDLTNQLTAGYSQGFNQDYFLWNMSAGKKFLKNQKGELKLSVFDVLKQNQSITRNVTGNAIQDVQNVVLQRFFMLTFTYNLKTFGQGNARPNNFGRGRFGGGGFPGY